MCQRLKKIYEIYLKWRDNPFRLHIYGNTSDFFESTSGKWTIMGVILTIVSIPPLFFSALFGENWYQTFISTSILGITSLDAIILATIFAAFFIYLLLALIFIQWLDRIWFTNINLGEKLFSLVILLVGAVPIGLLAFFISTIWFTVGHIPLALIGLNDWIFVLVVSVVFILIGVIQMIPDINDKWKMPIYGVVIFLLGVVLATMIIPSYNIHNSIINTTNNYAVLDTALFSFEVKPPINTINTPLVLPIQPDYSNYSNSSVNIDFVDCHWSTNYGYFLTINKKGYFVKKESNEFVIPKCIENIDENVYWTYELSDYGKNKPPVIISLQVENSNKRMLNEKSDSPTPYIIGGAHQNFTWNKLDCLKSENESYC